MFGVDDESEPYQAINLFETFFFPIFKTFERKMLLNNEDNYHGHVTRGKGFSKQLPSLTCESRNPRFVSHMMISYNFLWADEAVLGNCINFSF